MAGIIDKMRELLETQRNDPKSDGDEYMRGMFNGMELIVAIAEGRDPNYKDAPLVIMDGPKRIGSRAVNRKPGDPTT